VHWLVAQDGEDRSADVAAADRSASAAMAEETPQPAMPAVVVVARVVRMTLMGKVQGLGPFARV
jgi:hypothetical protein